MRVSFYFSSLIEHLFLLNHTEQQNKKETRVET